jgi:hypothetical protein
VITGGRARPCLEYDIKRCLAPCVREICSEDQYAVAVASTRLLLEGRNDELAATLRDRMIAAAADERYEEAAQLRDAVKTVQILREGHIHPCIAPTPDHAAHHVVDSLDDLLLEICPRIHHVVGHPQLLTQTGRIHQPFSAASALATHQPKGEPLHLPASGAEEGRRQGTVHPTGKAHGNALLPWPGPQALQHLLHCLSSSHCRSNSRNRSRRSRKGQGASHSFMLPVQLDQPRRSRWPGPPPTPSTS